MNLYAICEPGTVPYSNDLLHLSGFDVYATHIETDVSKIVTGKFTVDPRTYNFIHRQYECTQFENSLRASWVNMLEIAGDDNCIFGEADITPSPWLTADWLEQFLHTPAAELYDVILLHNNFLAIPAVDIPDMDGKCIVDVKQLMNTFLAKPLSHTANIALWGSHAIYIKEEARQEVIHAIKTIVGPVDSIFLHLGLNNILKVGKLTTNIFYQVKHGNNHKPIE